MEILLQNRKNQSRITNQSLRKKTALILNALDCKDFEISIVITNDEDMRQINQKYRNIDKTTNVLSFPMDDESMIIPGIKILGDLVISEDTALKEAQDARITLEQRVSQLLVHGILHLLGYDHETSDEDDKIMTKKSKELISIIENDKNLSWWM
ncbi:MAG: rRNA maturation RNase YbeY [Desulforegulaceae bacterium]|nr:rRNA maturation RNase YbeY [Desulforegulaceae bacterium]